MLQGMAPDHGEDAVQHDVELKQWRNSLSPHMVIMKSDLQVSEKQPQKSVTDAKSLQSPKANKTGGARWNSRQ